eukprot:1160762-Pelagomonas_calceolata.AAC.5
MDGMPAGPCQHVFSMKQDTVNNCEGTLFKQKHAVRFEMSTSLQCPLFGEPDSAPHIFSGYKRSFM